MKDRLPELQANVDAYDFDGDFFLTNYFATVDMEQASIDDFFRQADSVRSAIDKLSVLINHMEHLQSVMLASGWLTDTKSQVEDNSIEIVQLGDHVRVALQGMKKTQDERCTYPRIRMFLIEMLSRRFCTAMDRYFHCMIKHREKFKMEISRRLQLVGMKKTDDEIEDILEMGSFNMFPEISIEAQQTQQVLNDLKVRNQDLMKLKASIKILHDIFSDLAYLTFIQGEQLASIANKTSATEFDMGKTIEHLHAGVKIRRAPLKFRRMKFISALFSSTSRLFSSCI